jgi:GT2 family glycosyltransferase
MLTNVKPLASDKVPFFSIVILFWNSKEFIVECLEALSKQTDQDFEVIILDNGSLIPIERKVLENFSMLRINCYRLENNIGFAAGNNYAIQYTSGKYLVLLNADAFPEPEWLINVRKGIQKYPGCFFASKLIMANHPERYDGKGDAYHFSGLAWRKAYNAIIQHRDDTETQVFSACGAAAIYPKEAFTRIGGFDPDFFSYFEDVDLGFRLQLIGYKCYFLPDAVVKHFGSGSTGTKSDFSVYFGHRNLVWTYIKNMPGLLFWALLPFHVGANLLQVFGYLLRKRGRVTIRAKVDALKGIVEMVQKRKQIQQSRVVPISSIIRIMDWNPISPFLKVKR